MNNHGWQWNEAGDGLGMRLALVSVNGLGMRLEMGGNEAGNGLGMKLEMGWE